ATPPRQGPNVTRWRVSDQAEQMVRRGIEHHEQERDREEAHDQRRDEDPVGLGVPVAGAPPAQEPDPGMARKHAGRLGGRTCRAPARIVALHCGCWTVASRVGFEPTTKGLKVPCSATELPAREGPYHVACATP